jgi:hypothetical protein
MTIGRMRIASWISKDTKTLSEYVKLIASPLQRWLQERASTFVILTLPACLVLKWGLRIKTRVNLTQLHNPLQVQTTNTASRSALTFA